MNKKAVFILSHERALKCTTYKLLKHSNYKGDIFIVIDNKDAQMEEYKHLYGNIVIVYEKEKMYKSTDTVDNFIKENKTGLFARNFILDEARRRGYENIIMLDDDYKSFVFRYIKDGKLKSKKVTDISGLFDMMINYQNVAGIDVLSFGGIGDYLGGINRNVIKGMTRKAVNVFIINMKGNKLRFKGRINDDICTVTSLNSIGCKIFTVINVMLEMTPTGNEGGMKQIYRLGDYLKSFYPVVCMPSSCVVSVVDGKIYHKVRRENSCPKIISERYKK